MRRITTTTTCLLITVAVLSGCSGKSVVGNEAPTSSSIASSVASTPISAQASAPASPAAPPSPAAAPGGGAAPGTGASTGAPKGWPENSAQFSVVTQAAIRMATVIMKANGDRETVGKECAILAARVGGVQPEAGAPPEWALVLGDLQKASARCDAVRSDKPGAYEELDDSFFSAWEHLKPLIDHS